MVSIFDKVPKKLSVNDQKGTLKNGNPLDPDFGVEISGNNFDHKKHTVGFILSPISGP